MCREETLRAVLNGHNAGFIVYGQSGGGKTHSLFGDMKNLNKPLTPDKGIVQRALLDLFKIIASDGLRFDIYASLFEVYVEQIRDLARLFVDEHNKQAKVPDSPTRRRKAEEEKAGRSPGGKPALLRMSSKGLEVVDAFGGDTEIKELSKIRVKSEGDIAAIIQSGVCLLALSGE